MIYQLVVALAVVASASAKFFPEDPTQQKFLWEGFKKDFAKTYESMEEEIHRFHVFLENVKLADHRNEVELKHGGSATHGITKYSDLSQAEFESRYLTADPSMKSNNKNIWKVDRPVDTTASLIDWTGVYTTGVKDQGYCGSCWAFSATEQIESDAWRQNVGAFVLSPEQITQCTRAAFGCGGGWTETAYQYVHNTNGQVLDSDYPYTSYYGVTGTCNVASNDARAKVWVSSYYTIQGEDQMASYIQGTGPLSVCIDASTWSSYTGGVMTSCGQSINHCVQAVGVDLAGGYWKVRNSWGSTWGEAGHIRLAYGQNTCGITNDPTWVVTQAGGAH